MQAQEDQSAFTPSRLEKRKIVSELVSLLEKCGSEYVDWLPSPGQQMQEIRETRRLGGRCKVKT